MKKKIIIAVIFCIILTLLYIGVKDKENISINDLSKNIELITVYESYAANQKVTELAELATTPEGTDMVYIIDDPGGTPISKNITITNLLSATSPTKFNDIGDADGIGTINLSTFAQLLQLGTAGELKIGTTTDYFSFKELSGNYIFSITDGSSDGNIWMEFDLLFANEDVAPSATGNLKWDNTVTGLIRGALSWYDGVGIRYLLDYDTLPVTDGQIPIYNATNDEFVPLVLSGHATMDETGAVTLASTAVTPGSYTFTALTVDQQGRITAASSGSPGAETNSLETTITGIADTEIFIGDGADSGVFEALGALTDSIHTTGTLSGKLITATDADAHTLSVEEYHGGTVLATGAAIYTLPTVAAGYSGCVETGQGVTAIIQLLPASGDYIVKDGVRGTAATSLKSDGSAGDRICYRSYNADDWYVTVSGTWAE